MSYTGRNTKKEGRVMKKVKRFVKQNGRVGHSLHNISRKQAC